MHITIYLVVFCSDSYCRLAPPARNEPNLRHPDWHSKIQEIMSHLKTDCSKLIIEERKNGPPLTWGSKYYRGSSDRGMTGVTFLAWKIGASSLFPSHSLRSFSFPPVATCSGVSRLATIREMLLPTEDSV